MLIFNAYSGNDKKEWVFHDKRFYIKKEEKAIIHHH